MDERGEEFGPYVVYEQIGSGGMASVHRAETIGVHGFRRPIALKRMLPHVAANDDLVQSFVREARLASYLRHANVAQTYDLGKVGDVYFIAMELVTGQNLREILRHCLRTRQRVPIGITLNILNQICDALDYAHNLVDEVGQPLGIIHRDVSPSNIIVAETGVVKLIDFGIAKASASGMQTMSGMLKGKFGYMAPEYLDGNLDARADLFALGIIAHELLTNRPLFGRGDDLDTLYRVKNMRIDPPSTVNPDVPPEIDAIVMTALERDPDTRWQRASALRQALTTETQRLGLTVMDKQTVDWCEQAFGRDAHIEPRTAILRLDSAPSIIIERDDVPDLDGADDSRTDSRSEVITQPGEPPGDTQLELAALPRAMTTLSEATPTPVHVMHIDVDTPTPRPRALPMRAPAPADQRFALARPTIVSAGGPVVASAAAPNAGPLTGSRTMPNLSPKRTLAIDPADVVSEVDAGDSGAPIPPPPAAIAIGSRGPVMQPGQHAAYAPSGPIPTQLGLGSLDLASSAATTNVRGMSAQAAAVQMAPAIAPAGFAFADPGPATGVTAVPRTRGWVIALVMLAIAIASGVVVYFGLPYLQ